MLADCEETNVQRISLAITNFVDFGPNKMGSYSKLHILEDLLASFECIHIHEVGMDNVFSLEND